MRSVALASLMVILGCGRNSPSHTCEISGTVVTDDRSRDRNCRLDMYLEGRPDRLTHFPVPSGDAFRVGIDLPVMAPRQSWFAVVRCDGYEGATTQAFPLGAGWAACAPVDLGTINVKGATAPQ